MLQPGSQYKTRSGQVRIISSLGKGKSGYSHLVRNGQNKMVLKIMHDEENPFYSFGDDKLGPELRAYEILNGLDINLPRLLEYDRDRNYLLKRYIDGEVAGNVIAGGKINDEVLIFLFEMSETLTRKGFNIDYFPMNFVITPDNRLFYIDYEINPYSDEWNLLNWGIYYWINRKGMEAFLRTGDATFINENIDKGKPFKNGFDKEIKRLADKFKRTKGPSK